MSLLEYTLLVTTFGAVVALGLEAGIAVGILLSAASFAYSYAKVTGQLGRAHWADSCMCVLPG